MGLTEKKPVYGPLRAWLLTVPPREGAAYFTAGALPSVAVKGHSLERSVEHKEYLPWCVRALVSPYYLRPSLQDSSSEKVPLMHANPISGYFHYVTSVTKICASRCVSGHP